MTAASVIFALLVGGLLLVPVADRLRIPAPVLITIWGALLAVPPQVPTIELNPELLLTLVLPPLLFAAAQRTSWRQFLDQARAITLLAVVLVLITAAAVAFAAAHLHPALPVGVAVVLGTIVSPPDAAAATAVAGRLRLPRRLVTILEGEGLFNDVTALTLYTATVAGVVAGSMSFSNVAVDFGFSVVSAILIGFLVGFIAQWMLRWLRTSTQRSALSLLVPFAAYVPAAHIKSSGVLAVLVAAFYLGHQQDNGDLDGAVGRISSRSFWDIIELLVTVFTFGLVGLDLVDIVSDVDTNVDNLIGYAAVICLIVIVVRAVWLFPATYIAAKRARRRGLDFPGNWRETAVISWAGMRGVVTIATALALPITLDSGQAFPGREQVLFVAVTVVLGTLVIQGITLPWLIRVLKVGVDPDVERAAEQRVAAIAVDAALARLNALALSDSINPEIAERGAAVCRAIVIGAFPDEDEPAETTTRRQQLTMLEAELLGAARSALVDGLANRTVDPAAAERLLYLFDLRTIGRKANTDKKARL